MLKYRRVFKMKHDVVEKCSSADPFLSRCMICFSAWWSGTYGAHKRTSGHWALALHWHCAIACATSHRVDPSKIGLAPFAIQNIHENPKIFFPPATGQVPAVCWCFLSSATGPQPTGQCGGILQNSNRIRKDLMIGSVVVSFFVCVSLGGAVLWAIHHPCMLQLSSSNRTRLTLMERCWAPWNTTTICSSSMRSCYTQLRMIFATVFPKKRVVHMEPCKKWLELGLWDYFHVGHKGRKGKGQKGVLSPKTARANSIFRMSMPHKKLT